MTTKMMKKRRRTKFDGSLAWQYHVIWLRLNANTVIPKSLARRGLRNDRKWKKNTKKKKKKSKIIVFILCYHFICRQRRRRSPSPLLHNRCHFGWISILKKKKILANKITNRLDLEQQRTTIDPLPLRSCTHYRWLFPLFAITSHCLLILDSSLSLAASSSSSSIFFFLRLLSFRFHSSFPFIFRFGDGNERGKCYLKTQ